MADPSASVETLVEEQEGPTHKVSFLTCPVSVLKNIVARSGPRKLPLDSWNK